MRSHEVRSRVDRVIERAISIEEDTHQSTFLPVGIFDTASTFGELGMVTHFACPLRKEQGTAKVASRDSRWYAGTGRWGAYASR
jgi:hypothetical protein